MNRKLFRGLELALAVVLLVSLVMIVRTQRAYAKGASTYEEAAAVAKLPELVAIPLPAVSEETKAKWEMDGAAENDVPAAPDPNLVLLAEVDLDELWQINSDVLGWISIPETMVSYPILQGEDNDFYLKHTWQKASSSVGSIFMDYRSNPELTDFNTVIYGHRMRDRSMFGSLGDYKDQEHWRTHPSIYLADADGAYRYDIFAVYEASVTGPVYDLREFDTEEREEFIDACLEQSLIETGIVPTVDDHILTLSTCTGNGYANRLVVQAVLAESYDGNGD